MQELGRYVVHSLDACTYSILPIKPTGRNDAFLLMVTPLGGFHTNVQITLAGITNIHVDRPFFRAEFTHETWSQRVYAASWHQCVQLVSQILMKLDEGIDAANPAELSSLFGGELCGVEVQWPSLLPSKVH